MIWGTIFFVETPILQVLRFGCKMMQGNQLSHSTRSSAMAKVISLVWSFLLGTNGVWNRCHNGNMEQNAAQCDKKNWWLCSANKKHWAQFKDSRRFQQSSCTPQHLSNNLQFAVLWWVHLEVLSELFASLSGLQETVQLQCEIGSHSQSLLA